MKKVTFIFCLTLAFLAQDLFAQPTGRRLDAITLSSTEMSSLATAMLNYIDQDIIEEHSCNNEFGNAQNATGSIHGPEMFLNWHRQYLAEMEADPGVASALAAISGSGGLIPRWTQADGLTTPGFSAFQAVDADCASACGFGSCGSTPNGTTPNAYPYPNPLNCTTWADFIAFNQDLQYGYHNQGHNSLGGIMASFKSPATPIFWLWHGMIDDVYWDFQNDCIDDGDIHIKDTPADNASEPNNISTVLYASQDIWVRQNQDTPTGITGIPHGSSHYANEGSHENPEYKTSGFNYVYVRIRNESPDEFAGGRLRVYWSKASTGLNWPTTWNDYYAGTTVLHGDEMTPDNPFVTPTTQNPTGMPIPLESNFVLPPIEPDSQFIMEVPWVVPHPDSFTVDVHHFCILARIVSDFDEMDTPEGSALWLNVKNNNNIAWKNVQVYNSDPNNIVDPGGDPADIDKMVDFAGVYVTNPNDYEQVGNLTFKALENTDNQTFYDIGGLAYARMEVDLFKLWDQAGYAGDGVKILGEYNDKYYVVFTEPKAEIREMILPANSNYAMEMGYALTQTVKGGENFDYDVCQSDDREIIGGERYEIRIAKPRIRSSETALASITQLLIAPNPAKDQFTVSYHLPNDGTVSMSMFDISGRMVNQLPEQNLSKGYQTQLIDASNLPTGIYILRVQIGREVLNQKVIIE